MKATPYKTLKLKQPIELKGETIDSLEFVRLKAKHLKGMKLETMDMEDLLKIASNLCNRTMAEIGELDGEDIPAVLEIVGKLMEPFHQTGESA